MQHNVTPKKWTLWTLKKGIEDLPNVGLETMHWD